MPVTLLRRTVYTLALLSAPVTAALFLQSPAASAAPAVTAVPEAAASGSSFSPARPLAPNYIAAARAARTGGFAAASKWAPWKGALFGLFLYVLFAAAFFVSHAKFMMQL